MLDLLLFTKVQAVVGGLAAPLLDHARGRGTTLKGTFRGVATAPLEKQLEAVATAKAADRSGDASHDSLLLPYPAKCS
jgi:hypothetical protein